MLGYIDIADHTYKVVNYDENELFRVGYAYIMPEYPDIVLPFWERFHKNKTNKAGIYYKNDGDDFIIIRPFNRREYRIENIYEIDEDYIGKLVGDNNFTIDYNDTVIVGATDDIFNPPISQDDNILDRAMKLAFQAKEVDFNSYRSRFNNRTHLDNARRGVLKGNMTLKGVISLCEIFDLEMEIILRDVPGCVNPMNKEIRVSSNLDLTK